MNKISAIKYIIIALFVVFYQVIIMPRTTIGSIQADMALILTVWIALNEGAKEGLYFGLVMGLLMGVFNPMDLGWQSLLLSIIGFSLGKISHKLAIEPMPMKISLLFGAAIIFNFLYIFFTSFQLILLNPSYVVTGALFSALYSTAIGVIIFSAIRYRYVLRYLFE